MGHGRNATTGESGSNQRGTETAPATNGNETSWDRLFFPRVLDEPQRSMTIDCPDETCWLEFKVLATCVMYVPKPHSNCDIPCNLANCTVEVRHFFDCPVWTCKSKLTTLAPDPIQPTTIAPTPAPAHSGTAIGLYVSTAVNVFFGALFGFGIWKLWKIRRDRRNGYSDPSASLESGIFRFRDGSNVPHFSLDEPNEVEPLLSRAESQATQRAQRAHEHQNFLERLRNFRWSFASHRWVESAPENNDSTSRNTDPAPSAPTMPVDQLAGIANESVQLN